VARDVVLIVTPRYLPLLGGMERECALLAQEFRRRGLQPVIVTEQLGFTGLPRHETVDGVIVHRVPSSETRTLAVQLRVALAQTRLVLRYASRARFAIVRTMTLPALVVGLLKRLRLLRVPTLVTAETGGVADDVVALAERPLFPVSRALVSGHDVLNGLCGFNVDHLRRYGFPEAKIAMIPNGIDTSAWDMTTAPERVRRLLFLGRLDPAKGIFELLDALSEVRTQHPDVTLTVAGDGPAGEAMRARADELGLGAAVTFLGRVAYERLPEVFATVDALVLPSYSEGMPLSVLEAAAHHRVLVVTDVGDIRRLFGDRIELPAPRDTASLAAALERVVADPAPTTDYGDVVEAVSIRTVAATMIERLC
jgi:glycosyltransferase involved in cell wall biosynthesis